MLSSWRDAGVVYLATLERLRSLKGFREFESYSLRHLDKCLTKTYGMATAAQRL